jgi:hypothetical protein
MMDHPETCGECEFYREIVTGDTCALIGLCIKPSHKTGIPALRWAEDRIPNWTGCNEAMTREDAKFVDGG